MNAHRSLNIALIYLSTSEFPSSSFNPMASQAALQPQTPSLKTFYLFSNLPSELRVKIWRFSLQPRLIDVRLKSAFHPNGKPMPSPPEELALPQPYKAPLPTTFHVCHESRTEVKELYHVVGDKYYYPDRSLLFRLAMDRDFAEMVRFLAVPAVGLKAQGTMTENMIPVVQKFKKLRELIVVGTDESGGNNFYAPQEWDGEPRLMPGRPCPDGECTFWLHMFAGLVPVDVQTWQIKPAELLRYELMDEGIPEEWRPPQFRFSECRRYRDWNSHQS
jgi:2EXR family